MRSYDVQGRTVALPVQVRDASAGTVLYDVDAAAAGLLLPSAAFEVVQTAPGRAQLAVVAVDYRDNDLGAYREIGLMLFVRPRAGGPDGTFILRLPVDQPFTCAAGREIWGFPKTQERIDLESETDATTWTLEMDGQRVLRLRLPRGGTDTMAQLELTAYTLIEGVPHATAFRQGGTGAQVLLGDAGVTLELGDHPLATELAGLGLPAGPVLSTWTERMTATFEAPTPL